MPAPLLPTFNTALFDTPLAIHGTVNLRDAVYLYGTGPNTVAQARANADGTMPAVGIVINVDATTGLVEIVNSGIVAGFTGLTSGAIYYVSSATAGLITATPPSSRVQPVGIAISTTKLLLFPQSFGAFKTGPAFVMGDGTNLGHFVDSFNNVASGLPSLATNATDGFLYLPSCAGVPTGTPRGVTGMVPLVVDTTDGRLYAYIGGAWVKTNLA